MANSKILIASLVFTFFCLRLRAGEAGDSSLTIDLKKLKSKISVLESRIDERSRQLQNKDARLSNMEKIIQLKSDIGTALQHELESFQKKGTVVAEEQVGKAHARAGELEKQIEMLRKEVEIQNRKKEALEDQVIEAEKKMQEVTAKLETLEKINNEQMERIHNNENALQVAEEELMKAKLEATLKNSELKEVHGVWLPPWLRPHLTQCQSFVERHWNENGKPFLGVAIEKKLIPSLKDKWLVFVTSVGPYMQSATTKTIEVYAISKINLTPHMVKIQEMADTYFQEATKIAKPYSEQVATFAKPHINKARVALKPYTKKIIHVSGKFLKFAIVYHHQVGTAVLQNMKKHELTKPFATKEFARFMASAVLALPIFFMYTLFTSIFWSVFLLLVLMTSPWSLFSLLMCKIGFLLFPSLWMTSLDALCIFLSWKKTFAVEKKGNLSLTPTQVMHIRGLSAGRRSSKALFACSRVKHEGTALGTYIWISVA